MNRQIKYIVIEEARRLFIIGGKSSMETVRSAGIQEWINGNINIRNYDRISDASILRLAKIQEKLAQ